ncbi:MAG: HEAT repeat domain-containing protein [Pseudonocardiaceae bacterium]
MTQQIPENSDRQFVVAAKALLARRPVEVPGHELRRASSVWVDLDSGTGDGDRRELAVTIFPIGGDPDGFEDTWIVAARGGDHYRYERLDRNGQCRMSGLSSGRWSILLLAADQSFPKSRPVAATGSSSSKPLPDVGKLIRAVTDDNPITCCEALDALRALAGGETWPDENIEPIAGQLRDNPEAIVRKAAAELLGEVGGLSAVSPLLRALDDPTWSVQYAAASSLGLIGDPDTKARLTAIAGDADRDPVGFQKSACAFDLGGRCTRPPGHDRAPCRCACST